MLIKKQWLEPCVEQLTHSGLRKEYDKFAFLSLCLCNLYIAHIMENAGPDELQARIKVAGRNISTHRDADGIALMAESEEELKNLLMRVKEESEKASFKVNTKKKDLVPSLLEEEKGSSDRFPLLVL